jgi:hypothetical protein
MFVERDQDQYVLYVIWFYTIDQWKHGITYRSIVELFQNLDIVEDSTA